MLLVLSPWNSFATHIRNQKPISDNVGNEIGNEILGLEMTLSTKIGLDIYIRIQKPISDDVGNEISGLETADTRRKPVLDDFLPDF